VDHGDEGRARHSVLPENIQVRHSPAREKASDIQVSIQTRRTLMGVYLSTRHGQGFTQQKGLDYEEIFALQGLQILLIDIDNTYLHGEIDTEVYMTQPPGYIDLRYPNHVCKLLKGLYGLKQAGLI
jgi:Reverse transcriptase (RNA-dependent DNA polymerase)